MSDNKNISVYFDAGAVGRTPQEILKDSTLSKARKIELLKGLKARKGAPKDKGVLRDGDLELEKLLELNSLAHRQ